MHSAAAWTESPTTQRACQAHRMPVRLHIGLTQVPPLCTRTHRPKSRYGTYIAGPEAHRCTSIHHITGEDGIHLKPESGELVAHT